MLMRFDPFREFDRMASQLLTDGRAPRAMPMDAYRQDDELVVDFDLPGVEPDSIDLTVEHNVLTVTARRDLEHTDSDDLIANERPRGIFSRQVFLGQGLETDRLDAAYDRGVLRIRVPVSETAKPRRIPVAVETRDQRAITAGADAG